jgi:hypothetical protein
MKLKYAAVTIDLILLFIALSAQANSIHQEPEKPLSANQIAKEAYLVQHGMHFKNSVVKKSNGKSAMVLNRMPGKNVSVNIIEAFLNNDFNDGKTESKSLAIMKSGRLRGTGILMINYLDATRKPSISLWLPSLRKVRRISLPNHADKWMGTNMTYGDVYLRRPEHETHELLGTRILSGCLKSMILRSHEKTKTTKFLPEGSCSTQGKEVYQLKSSTKFKNWWYDYRITDIDRLTFATYQSVYIKDGKPVKTIEIDWRSVDPEKPGMIVPNYIYAKSVKGGQESMIFIPAETIKTNTKIRASFWTEKTLRKINR